MKYYGISNSKDKLLNFNWDDQYEKSWVTFYDTEDDIFGFSENLFTEIEEVEGTLKHLNGSYLYDLVDDIDISDLRVVEIEVNFDFKIK